MRIARAGRALFILSCACGVTAVAARLPHMGWMAPVGAAMAQDTGHTDDGHTGGPGGSGGGHTEGDAGHSGGPGGHGAHGGAVAAVDEVGGHGSPLPLKPAGSFRAPDYFRFELGLSAPRANNAYWLPSNYPSDPKVLFNLDLKRAAYGSLAVGHYWGGGLRSEVALTAFGPSDFSTTSTTTVPPTPGTHATMTGTTSSYLVMANGYYTPYIEALGRVQPYVSAGIGVSANTMGTWTRTNPTKPTAVRSFEGNTTVSLAGAVGVGLEVYMGEVSGKPTSLDFGYRYYALGNVSGSATPITGSSSPTKPLNFNKTDQVVSVSVRVWF